VIVRYRRNTNVHFIIVGMFIIMTLRTSSDNRVEHIKQKGHHTVPEDPLPEGFFLAACMACCFALAA
jgi:hypothetical protein